MRFKRRDSSTLALMLFTALIWAGCTEREAVTDPETTEPTGVPPVHDIVAALSCTANVAAERLTCEAPERFRGVLDPQFLIVGGQNQFVTLSSVGVFYDNINEVFHATVTVENLIDQQMGTPDGIETTGVNVFFHTGPSVTSGSGTVTVSNADGTGSFTGSDQPFHAYDEILAPAGTTFGKDWQWSVPTTVTTFTFEVFVQADVPGEQGHVVVSPAKALVNPTDMVALSSTINDAVGRPQGGSVTYSTSDPTVATVDPNTGMVTAQAGGRAVITSTTGGPEADGTAVITVFESGYQIELNFLSNLTMSQQTAFENARDRWEAIVTNDLPNADANTNYQPFCLAPINEFVDDLVINVVVGPIDEGGSGGTNILGAASPCLIRTSSLLTAYGLMIFDEFDVGQLEMDGQLETVILHEMGHVLGIGSLWAIHGKLLDVGEVPADCDDTGMLVDPYFDGSLAIAAFNGAGGGSYGGNKVPVEDMFGEGTRCVHWREAVMDDELMTGIIEAPATPNPLSEITIQSLADLGYVVDVSQADAYMLPAPLAPPAASGGDSGLLMVDDIWRGPVFAIAEDGSIVQFLPDRRPGWQRELSEIWQQ